MASNPRAVRGLCLFLEKGFGLYIVLSDVDLTVRPAKPHGGEGGLWDIGQKRSFCPISFSLRNVARVLWLPVYHPGLV